MNKDTKEMDSKKNGQFEREREREREREIERERMKERKKEKERERYLVTILFKKFDLPL